MLAENVAPGVTVAVQSVSLGWLAGLSFSAVSPAVHELAQRYVTYVLGYCQVVRAGHKNISVSRGKMAIHAVRFLVSTATVAPVKFSCSCPL